MKIINIVGREIFDSRGFPTIACDIYLEDGSIATASVPAGKSKSNYEAKELRDADRLMGMGVSCAVDVIKNIIEPQFLGKVPNAIQMDLDLIQMDGTPDKSKLGANAMLAFSMAMYRAHAMVEEIQLFDFIALVSGSDTVSLPMPMINLINGGLHADNNLAIQEYLVIPYGALSIKVALESSVLLFNKIREILALEGKSTLVGDEGGFAPAFDSATEPFDLILKAIEELEMQDVFTMGIDVAASRFYDVEKGSYDFNGVNKSSKQMIDWYSKLIKKYKLHSIEDGLAQDDWAGWIALTDKLGQDVQIAADDLFATNSERIIKGIELGVANTVVIKPNQIGTVTETLQAIQLCKEQGLDTIVSNRSGETCDTFIVDIAVGASTTYIKCGGLSRGERMAKYNRLLEIDHNLTNIVTSE